MELAQLVTVSAEETTIPRHFREHLAQLLDDFGRWRAPAVKRNPGEVFRQYFSAMRARMHAILEPGAAKPYGSPDELVKDLLEAEKALGQVEFASLARNLVKPVRWEAQIFGFRTVSLDLRQNTTVLNRVLVELFSKLSNDAREPVAGTGQPGPGRSGSSAS